MILWRPSDRFTFSFPLHFCLNQWTFRFTDDNMGNITRQTRPHCPNDSKKRNLPPPARWRKMVSQMEDCFGA